MDDPNVVASPTRGSAVPGSSRKSGRKGGALAALAVLGALAGGGWYYFHGTGSGSGPGAGDELTYTVARGPLRIAFNEKGTIKASKSEQVYSMLEGMSTIVFVVPEGSYVKKGDVLVELDSSDLTQQHNQQKISVESAEAALSTAQEQLKIQELQNKSDLQKATLDVALAQLDLQKYENGDKKIAFAKAEADIEVAIKEKERAGNKFTWTQKLASKGYVTKSELDTDQISMIKAEIQHKQALQALDALKNYTSVKDEKKYSSDLEQAQAALQRVTMKANALKIQAEADLKAKESTRNLSLRRLQKLEDQLEKTKILAPQDGMVVYQQDGRFGRSDRIIEQGGTVRENQHLINLPDLSVMAVEVSVPEARIHQVKQDLLATVTIDSQTQVVLRGKVTKIGLLPDYVNRWLNPDLKVYTTDITIDSGQDTTILRPGMSAKVEVLVEEIHDALFVPIQSVTTIDGEQVVYLLGGKGFEPRKVQIGPSNNSHIQILAGLSEGDRIQLNAPKPQGVPKKEREELEKAGPSPEELGKGPGGAIPVPASFTGNGPGGAGAPGGERRRGPGAEVGAEGEKGAGGGPGGPGDRKGGKGRRRPEGFEGKDFRGAGRDGEKAGPGKVAEKDPSLSPGGAEGSGAGKAAPAAAVPASGGTPPAAPVVPSRS